MEQKSNKQDSKAHMGQWQLLKLALISCVYMLIGYLSQQGGNHANAH